jgi:polyisoprenoid-binding protein YceI
MKYCAGLFIVLFLGQLAHSQTLIYQKDASQISWTGRAALTNYRLTGTLPKASGWITIKDDDIESASITIDMKALRAENNDLEKHLKSTDFFDVNTYGTAVFELAQLIYTSEATTALGQLTIKDITVDMDIPIVMERAEEMWKISGTLVFDRTRFGIVYNSPSFFENLKDQAIADEIILEFVMVFQ